MPWLLLVSALLALVLAASLVGRRRSPGALAFIGVLVGIGFYAAGYALELVTPPGTVGLGGNLFWNHFQYVGVSSIPAFWLWVALETPRSEKLTSPLPIFFLAEAAVTLVLNWTNSWHHWYYVNLSYTLEGGLTRATIVPGVWYLIHSGFTWLSFPLGAFLFYWEGRRHRHQKGAASTALVIAVLPTLAAFVLYQTKLVPGGWDLIPLGLSVTGFLFFWLLWPFQVFSLRPVTREAVFRLVPDPVLVVDPQGRLVDWNPAALELFPGLADRGPGEPVATLVRDFEGWEAALAPTQAQARAVLALGRTDPTWWAVTNSPVSDAHGRLAARVFLLHEQTDLVHRAEVYEHLALVDDLTGCLNRRAFVHQARAVVAGRAGRNEPVALISLDLDHFKAVNDTWGHGAGDAALKHAVTVWQAQLRTGDLLGRLGGEEFAVLLPGASRATAAGVAERLCTSLRTQPFRWEGRELSVTASLGVAGAPDAGTTTFEVLLRNADAKMYEAKAAGRDRVVCADQPD